MSMTHEILVVVVVFLTEEKVRENLEGKFILKDDLCFVFFWKENFTENIIYKTKERDFVLWIRFRIFMEHD